MAKAALTYRFFELDRSKVNKDTRTVPILFSTEAAVNRGGYDEILDHSENAVDMSRMRDGAPFLLNHNANDQIGVVESAEVNGKEGRAIVRFGKSPLAEQIFQDITDGIRKHVSVGYERTKAVSRQKLTGGRDAIRFAWMPYEVSSVPIPADPNTGVGRSDPNDPLQDPMKRNLLFDAAPADGNGNAAVIDRVKITNDIRTTELKRIQDISAMVEEVGKKFPEAAAKFRSLSTEHMAKETSAEAFGNILMKQIPGVQEARQDGGIVPGMTEKEKRQYSFMGAIQKTIAKLEGRGKGIDGLELDVSNTLAKESGQEPQGFFVPIDLAVDTGRAMRFARGQRDLNVTTASQGGNFVQTSIQTPIIEILRNRMVTQRLGVQTLSGLQGNLAIPRQSGAATAYTVSEQGALTISTQAIQQISITPHRVGAYNKYSKMLLLQSSVDVENFMRDDLMKVLAIKLDQLTLEGAGGTDPIGVKNTSGIGSETFGAAATWAKIIDFETTLASANADNGNMAYITTPAARAKLKAAVKIAASTTPTFIWEIPIPQFMAGNGGADYGVGTMNPGLVNGYSAYATKQISSDYMAFGNWQDDIFCQWGGFDIVVDPYSIAETATTRIIVNTFVDNVVRHAASFVWSTDSAAQ